MSASGLTDAQREALEARTHALASLEGTPGWEALKAYLTIQTAHTRLDFTDAQWAGRKAYQDGRTDLALDLLRMVEIAVKRRQPQHAGA